jgi:hypothetical protein
MELYLIGALILLLRLENYAYRSECNRVSLDELAVSADRTVKRLFVRSGIHKAIDLSGENRYPGKGVIKAGKGGGAAKNKNSANTISALPKIPR